METELTQKKCVPCEGGVPKLGEQAACMLMPQVPGWEVRDELPRTDAGKLL